jgi:hypothetical protein
MRGGGGGRDVCRVAFIVVFTRKKNTRHCLGGARPPFSQKGLPDVAVRRIWSRAVMMMGRETGRVQGERAGRVLNERAPKRCSAAPTPPPTPSQLTGPQHHKQEEAQQDGADGRAGLLGFLWLFRGREGSRELGQQLRRASFHRRKTRAGAGHRAPGTGHRVRGTSTHRLRRHQAPLVDVLGELGDAGVLHALGDGLWRE